MQMNHDQQAQAAILQRNVSAIAEMQHRETSQRTFQDHIAAALTDFSGSMAFVYIHALWFAIWFVLNLGIFHIPGITGLSKPNISEFAGAAWAKAEAERSE